MESISTPQVINMPFCADGDKNTIPSAATGTQRASLEEGFPEITSKPISEGGIPPEREDFNGAMNLNSQFYFAFQNGWWPTFDADVSTAIGGYPLGAVLWWFPTTGEYANMAVPLKSLVANNTYNFNTNTSYIGVYWQPLYKQPNALPIGTVFGHQSKNVADVPGALPLFTGETISSANTMYPDFYNWVLSHTELQISAADYESAITTYGECPKYVIDDTNKTIRLPKLTNYIKMANTTAGITQSAAGLPNITGEQEHLAWSSRGGAGSAGTGAFTKSTSTGGEGSNTGDAYNSAKVVFDASDSNPIYGNSDTNTPAHTTLFPWVCAYNAAVPASTAQAAEFQQALTGKADTNLSNVTGTSGFRKLVEVYNNGTSWCKVFDEYDPSTGTFVGKWCEQGGRFYNNANTANTINFLKEFADTNFSVFINHGVNGVYGGGLSGVNADEPYDFTTTGFKANTYPAVGVNTIQWEAKGYIN